MTLTRSPKVAAVDREMTEAARLRRFLDEVEGYTDVARNERVGIRIIDGPASELIPPGRGRSHTRGMRP